jgi:hypothetical protein
MELHQLQRDEQFDEVSSDAISVFGDDNFAILDAIRKTSEIRAALPPLFPV